jgi:hypothetical protein
MELEIIILSKVSQIKKDKGCMVFLMWSIDPKDKCMHKYKHHMHRERGREMEREKERERENVCNSISGTVWGE